MVATTSTTQCFVCNKGKIVYKCGGCSKDFCFDHLTEHRQKLNKQLNEIEDERNLFQQTLLQQKEDSKIHLLIEEINQWEENSITKIKQRSKEKLTQLTEEMAQPPNISIRQDSTSFINKISVIVSSGDGLNQLFHPFGLYVNDDLTIYIADKWNHRIVEWKYCAKSGQVVAGGHGQGNHLNQLNFPTYIYIDEDYSLYISDSNNHRVMKWMKDAKEGIVVAGGKVKENSLTQLTHHQGVIVDQLGQIYVADSDNHRVIRLSKEATPGDIILGENGQGEQSNEFDWPMGLSFDRQCYLYVADNKNHRIQKFEIDLN